MRAALLASALLVGGTLQGCDSERFLSGQWFTSQTEAGFEKKPNATTQRWIELNLGHYGEDVVGIIRFYGDQNRTITEECASGSKCTCQQIDGHYDLDAETVYFRFVDCDGKSRTAAVTRVSSDELSWRIDDVPQIDRFRRTKSENQLTIDRDKACTQCGSSS